MSHGESSTTPTTPWPFDKKFPNLAESLDVLGGSGRSRTLQEGRGSSRTKVEKSRKMTKNDKMMVSDAIRMV